MAQPGVAKRENQGFPDTPGARFGDKLSHKEEVLKRGGLCIPDKVQ
jgi:hypothetical protein